MKAGIWISLLILCLAVDQEARAAGDASCAVVGNNTEVRYAAPSGAANSIVYTLSGQVECFEFINGDIGVVGPVTVLSVTPDHSTGCANSSACRNGWMRTLTGQPSGAGGQGFDSRDTSFRSSLFGGNFPQTISGPSSVIKSVSDTQNNCPGNVPGQECLQYAAVLTILDEAPQNAAMMFRPPMYGRTARVSETRVWSDIDWGKLSLLDARLAPTRPSFGQIQRRFEEVQLEAVNNFLGRKFHPEDNFQAEEYHGIIADTTSAAVMRFVLDDFDPANSDHRRAAAAVIQYGYDMAWMYAEGGRWGDHSNGRQAIAAFAAHMFNDQSLSAAVASTAHGDREGQMTSFSTTAQRALFGLSCSEADYWNNQRTGGGVRFCKDPYGYIDGPDVYVSCCLHGGLVAGPLAIRLAGAESSYNRPNVLEYGYRRYSAGYWAAPDPCLAASAGGGPNGSGGCIQGTPSRSVDNVPHGSNADNVMGNTGMFNAFVRQMKQRFYDCSVDQSCDLVQAARQPEAPVILSNN